MSDGKGVFNVKPEHVEQPVTVRLGSLRNRDTTFGTVEFTVNLTPLVGDIPRNPKGYAVPIKLNWTLRKDIVNAVFGALPEGAWEEALTATNDIDLWRKFFMGKVVELYAALTPIRGKDGKSIERNMVRARATNLQATPEQSLAEIAGKMKVSDAIPPMDGRAVFAGPASSTVAAERPSAPPPATAKDQLTAALKDEQWGSLAAAYVPAEDNAGKWMVAMAKFGSAKRAIEAAGEQSIEELNAGGKLEALLAPHKLPDVLAAFNTRDLTDLYPLSLLAVREGMNGVVNV